MIVLYNCSQEGKKVLDELMNTGSFSDYSEIISLAVMNLKVLHDDPNDAESL